MPRANPLQATVNAGEFSPRMAARVDFRKYAAAGSVVRNLIPLTQGGLTRRPGTRFVGEVKDSTAAHRVIPFQFSTEQAYILEAGPGALRFYRNQGRILAAANGAAITNGAFTNDISGWDDRSTGSGAIAHDAANARLALTGAGAGNTAWAEQAITTAQPGQEHVLRFRVAALAGDTLALSIGATSTGGEIIADRTMACGYHALAFTPAASPFYVQFKSEIGKTIAVDDVTLIDNAPVEIASPYDATALARLKWAQSADVLYIAAGKAAPVHKLLRFGHTSWSLVEVAWGDGPWRPANTGATTLAAAATTGLGVTITASAASGINDDQGFLASDVGRLVRLAHDPNEPGYGVIAVVNSATQVVVDIRRDFNAATPTTAWRLGAWSATTGQPAALAFYEQRLAAAATTAQPQSFWLSQSADIENFRPDSFVAGAITVESDDALDFTIAADQVNAIRWLSPGRQLVLGTAGGEWVVKSDGPVVTPSDIDVKRQTAHGCADIQPQRVGHVVLFVQAARRKLREFAFRADAGGHRAPDLTILADHVTESGVTELAYQQEPHSLVWCALADGTLAALTYQRDEDVLGWSRHIIGGVDASANAFVESIATIPGNAAAGQAAPSDDRNELWLVVRRTVAGVTRRYVEVLEGGYKGPARDDFASNAAWEAATLARQTGMAFADSLLTYDGAPTTTITGLDHLEGEAVTVLADGAVHPARTVAGGAIVLQGPAAKAQVGLAYTHRFRTLKLAAGARAGTAVVKTKRIARVGLVLLDTATFRIGFDRDAGEAVAFREVGDAMDTAVPLFTGERAIELAGDFAFDPRIVIEGDAPAAFTLLALAPEILTNALV